MSENDRYLKTISEASYKQNIRTVSSTDANLAWFEETGETFPRVDASNIWQDYKYVKDDPGDANEFYVSFGGKQQLVWKKYDKLELAKQDGYRALFQNKLFNNIIIKENYHVELFDAEKDKIPFGLKKWSYDPNNGFLSFIEGLPEGYDCSKLYVTFYRYEGRMLLDAALTSEGSVDMVDGYQPKKDQSVATKKYVDDQIEKIDTTISLMKPPKPQTLEGTCLKFEGYSFEAYNVVSGDKCDTVVLPEYEFSLTTERVWNPGEGSIELVLNDYVFASINLREPKDNGCLKIVFLDDFYTEIYASRGFYNGVQVKFVCKAADLPAMFSQNQYLKVKIRTNVEGDYKSSDEFVIGLEPSVGYTSSSHVQIDRDTNYKWQYISGVPTPAADSTLRAYGYENTTLKNFKSNNEIGLLSLMGIEVSTMPKNSYSVRFPIHNVEEKVKIPANFYTEKLKVKYESFDIFGAVNKSYEEEFSYRIDTMSNEEHRVRSGEGEHPDEYGEAWNPKESLVSTNELQMLAGKWVWPERDFSVNGNISPITQFDPSWVLKGPDYSKTEKTGMRYATFEYNLPVSNGVFIDIPELLQDKDTHAFIISSMQLKVDGATEWLDAKKAYKGVCIASKRDEGCLAVQDSGTGFIYCTFGPKALEGRLLVRIGRHYEERDFSTPKVTPWI